GASLEPEIPVGAAADRLPIVDVGQRRASAQVPLYARKTDPGGRGIGTEFLLEPDHTVAGERGHLGPAKGVRSGVPGASELPVGHRGQGADREPRRQAPGDLGRAQDRGLVRLIDEVAGGRAPGRLADAAGIEVPLTAPTK